MTDLDLFLAEATAKCPIPGVSLSTLRRGERGPEYHFGIRGTHDNAVVDARTIFEAASLTKPLVAFIALQLVEERHLDPNEPLFDICDEYVPGDLRSRQITAFHPRRACRFPVPNSSWNEVPKTPTFSPPRLSCPSQ